MKTIKADYLFHFGIYGIVLKDSHILLVQKSRGPYLGKLDLPGGKPEFDEQPTQTLEREILEETGITIKSAVLFDIYSTATEYNQKSFYHIGAIYKVCDYDDTNIATTINFEDSAGAQWYEITKLSKVSLTPFAQKALL